MSSPDSAPANLKQSRLRLGPLGEALLFMILVAIAIWISLTVIYSLSNRAMEGEIKAGLSRQVSVVARMLDGELGDLHRQFTPEKLALAPDSLPRLAAIKFSRENAAAVYTGWTARLAQDNELREWRDSMLASPAYTDWAGRMERVRLAAQDTRYAYTNVRIGERIYFGANMTLQGDVDGDGKIDDAPSLLCPYPDHEAALIKALDTKTTQVTPHPYTDIWGTYYGGYAPFYDSAGNVVGTVGMDLELSSFKARMLPITRAVYISMGVGLALALFCGALVYFSRVRIARITYQLEVDRLLLANANAEIKDLNQQLKGENIRMGAELDVTRRLQMLTLPKEEELRDAADQLQIAAIVKPANEVGGDYYDVIRDKNNVRIAIGDVTGHGLESGMVMLMAQTAMRTLIDAGIKEPTAVLPAVNRTLYRQIARIGCDRNMTLALIDYHNGQVTVCGQHEELIVVRANGEVERVDTCALGFYVGMIEHIDDMVATAELQLQPGDLLVLYTDGIPEAAAPDGSLYGLDRLCNIVRDARTQSAQQIKDLVISDVESYIGTQTIFDDITLVICKRIEA
ncbi:MAG: response regulator receiver modulated serine phosphatase [Chthoniobacteraceae bacterium]|nr:response regulator receiver modulated serine phosphatase [Chthoniobacteraceae bacterium]